MARHTGEDFVDVEGVAVSSVLSLQSPCINGSELDAPETYCFSADSDSSFSEEIFYVAVTQIESEVEPDSVADDVGWETVAFICVHPPIVPIQ